jgi:glutathione S-transferase
MLKIYGIPVSVHTRKAIVLAIAKKLPHEIVPVVPVIPDNPPPNWRELSATGKIPALTDGDFVLFDSAAICAYMERLEPAPSFYPQGSRAYATALSLEQYAGTLFQEIVRPLFHEVFVHPKIHNIPTDQRRIDAILSETVPEIFGYLDGALESPYLAGSTISIADISVVSNLVTYQYIGFDPYRDRYPRLAALFDRVIDHPAVRETLRREQAIVDSMKLSREFLAEATVQALA